VGVFDRLSDKSEKAGLDKLDKWFDKLADRVEGLDRERISEILGFIPNWDFTVAQEEGQSEVQALGGARIIGWGTALEVFGVGLDLTIVGIEVGVVLNAIGGYVIALGAIAPFVTKGMLEKAGSRANERMPELYGALGDFAQGRFEGVEFSYLSEWEPTNTFGGGTSDGSSGAKFGGSQVKSTGIKEDGAVSGALDVLSPGGNAQVAAEADTGGLLAIGAVLIAGVVAFFAFS
jgi:hypothetical protein